MWVRIDDRAIDHPKFVALSANAFRLWVEGMTYCQRHLTDGFIPRAVLKGMRYYSVASVRLLTAVLVPDKGPLWHEAENGVQVHDYPQWNETREAVLLRREDARQRMERTRAQRSREQVSEQPREQSANECVNELRSSGTDWERNSQKVQVREGGSGETPLSVRAGNFAAWYAETHERLIGVAYIGNPQRDYQAALEICKKLNDLEARDAAIVWFGSEDDFARNGTRTIPKFASRASDCLLKARRVSA